MTPPPSLRCADVIVGTSGMLAKLAPAPTK
jgi:hypothetical protein